MNMPNLSSLTKTTFIFRFNTFSKYNVNIDNKTKTRMDVNLYAFNFKLILYSDLNVLFWFIVSVEKGGNVFTRLTD